MGKAKGQRPQSRRARILTNPRLFLLIGGAPWANLLGVSLGLGGKRAEGSAAWGLRFTVVCGPVTAVAGVQASACLQGG